MNVINCKTWRSFFALQFYLKEQQKEGNSYSDCLCTWVGVGYKLNRFLEGKERRRHKNCSRKDVKESYQQQQQQ